MSASTPLIISNSERSPGETQWNPGIIRVPQEWVRVGLALQARPRIPFHSIRATWTADIKKTLKFQEWTFHGFLSILIAAISGIR